MNVSCDVAGMPMLCSLALKLRLPDVSMDTMRLLPVSETQMLPSGATATPHGTLNAICTPVPTGFVIGTPQTPEGEMLWMRLLSVSAIQIVPSGATEIPVGLLRSPAGEADPAPNCP